MREGTVLLELKRRLPEILPEGRVRWIKQTGDAPGLEADFSIGGARLRLAFEGVSRPNLAGLRDRGERLRAQAGGRLPIVTAPHLNAEMRDLCRTLGVGYIDLSGNVWISRGPVVIRKDVAKNLFPHQSKERSPFADRASRILRYLIDKKEPQGVRRIAAESGLDPGYVSRVLHSARDLGYVGLDARGRALARRHEEMLADWSAFYAWRRNRVRGYFTLELAGHPLEDELARILQDRDPGTFAFTLHAGNNRVEPFVDYGVAHLYVAPGSPLVGELEASLKLRPVPVEGANLVLVEPYYRDSVFFGARRVEGLWVVSDLQLYLDLRRFPVRGQEASERILDRRLRPLWGEPR